MKKRLFKKTDRALELPEGVIIIFQSRTWGATTKMRDEDIPDDIPKEVTKHTQELIKDKYLLLETKKIVGSAKRLISDSSIPFPIPGAFFIPKRGNNIELLAQKLDALRDRFNEAVNVFADSVKDLEANYKAEYPQLYRPEKYLTRSQLLQRFYFRFTFRSLAVPTGNLLPQEMIEREYEKMKDDVMKMKDDTLNIVANKMLSITTRLQEQCEGGRINSKTLSAFVRFIERFENLYNQFAEDKGISKDIDEMKDYLDDVDADMLNIDDEFREMVGDKMNEITKNILSNKKVKPNKRFLDL